MKRVGGVRCYANAPHSLIVNFPKTGPSIEHADTGVARMHWEAGPSARKRQPTDHRVSWRTRCGRRLTPAPRSWSNHAMHGRINNDAPTRRRCSHSLCVGIYADIVGMKNGCTMATTCDFVSGSSNAIVNVLARSMSLGMLGSVARFARRASNPVRLR